MSIGYVTLSNWEQLRPPIGHLSTTVDRSPLVAGMSDLCRHGNNNVVLVLKWPRAPSS